MNNNFDEIRNGLTNYIFSCLSAMPYEGDEAKHFLVSILTEEALNISKDSDNKISMFAIKPILRACLIIFNERINILQSVATSQRGAHDVIQPQIDKYNQVIDTLNYLIENIKE